MGQSKLRTPLSYYGGKQKLAGKIVSLIPEHSLYCEPFIGGAAVYFAKEKSNVEVINDTNSELVNFYKVCKNKFHLLKAKIDVTLHSRAQHDDAFVIYNKPHLFDEIERAWAVWVLACQSFSSQLDNSWGFDIKKNSTSLKIHNRREDFASDLAIRLQTTQIEYADAIYIIKSRDTENSFFYCDPPYFNSDCGHYDGYSKEDFENLLKTLCNIKGKFLLSSYPSDLLHEYTQKNGWHTWTVDQKVTVNAKSGKIKRKVEVLTANYFIM
ncbi:MAG: DNA adenine methylase [Sphingobacteriales bacterium]|nr:DNA adenine methylase [Sphingobacteriales bacterium]